LSTRKFSELIVGLNPSDVTGENLVKRGWKLTSVDDSEFVTVDDDESMATGVW
jgi:hypothetical protein